MTTSTRIRPTVEKVFSRKGVAGQFAVQATVTYPGEDPQTVEFVGSAFDGPGPVLMVTEHGHTWVTDPGRFGKFGKAWVRRFFE